MTAHERMPLYGAEIMKALSIRQPWAWAIIHAGKDIENRTWKTKFRGPLLIHAGKGMTATEYCEFCEFYENLQYARPNGRLPKMPGRLDLPRGGIIGAVELVDCVTDSTSKWFTGPVGFALNDPRPCAFRPFAGQLGLFELPQKASVEP